MFGTSRFTRATPVSKVQDDIFEMGSRSFSTDGASSSHSSAVEDVLEPPSESPILRMTLRGIPPSTQKSAALPIDAPENKRKFTGTTGSTSKMSLSFASLFMRPRKQRQSSTSSLSSVDSTEFQLM